MEHIYAVIMAGGGGTRLWPVSRRGQPKHLLPLLGEETLFCSTVSRLNGLVSPEQIFVVTTLEQYEALRSQAPEIPSENFLIEPQPRGTAAVIGLAATVLLRRDPQAVMMVLPSDHLIRNADVFRLIMRAAVQVANQNYLVTLGIPPSFPSTGYGYIQRDALLSESADYPAYRVLRFVEKPDEARARQMLATGGYYWNSGMFIWRADRILSEINRLMPDLARALASIGAAWDTPERDAVLRSEWPRLEPQTIDYGVMEHAQEVAVLPASGLEWNDVGSWDSFFDVVLPDEAGNVVVNSDHLPFDTYNSLIYSVGKKLIVTIGVDDLIVVEAGDALLLCHRDRAQQVRQVIETLKTTHREHYL